MPPRKELHYFNERGHTSAQTVLRNHDARDLLFLDKLRRLGTQSWLDLIGYGQLFVAKGSLLSGDITPAYCTLPEEIIEMVMRTFPKLKVILLARDPVERAWSALSLSFRTGGIRAFDATDFDQVMHQLLHPMMLARSYPSTIVGRWRRHVPPQINLDSIFLTICKTIPPNCGARSLPSSGAIRTSLAIGYVRRTITIPGKPCLCLRRCGFIWLNSLLAN